MPRAEGQEGIAIAEETGKLGRNLRQTMVTKLLHTRMRVDDLERTVKFYEDALGLKVARRHTLAQGVQLVFLQTPDNQLAIEICRVPQGEGVRVQPDLMHVAFAVDDMATFAAQLEKKGYRLRSGPTKSALTGSILAFLDAPEGYGVELIQLAKA